MRQIVTLTVNPTIDKYATVPHVVSERKLRCERPVHDPGGGGINVSRVIRTLGLESLAVHTAGGALGDMLVRLLTDAGVGQHTVPIEGQTRETLTVLETSTGRQYRFGMPGPELSQSEWHRCADVVEEACGGCDYLVASGSLPPGVPSDFYVRIARAAKKRGSRMILDTSGEALRAGAGEGVFLLKPNLRELAHLAGREVGHDADQRTVALRLIEQGFAEAVVVSLGRGGAILVTASEYEHVRAPSVPAKSKVGAGDSMVAGIVVALARGDGLMGAVRFGVAAGSAAVMTQGTELCRKDDVERLYREMI
jgi:6-phosphofructokinase 2